MNNNEEIMKYTYVTSQNKETNGEMYYIGIGASAGGLEALEELFHFMPEDTGMAFIVIQHLSPDYKSLMNELLARKTNMKVIVAQHDMLLEPNTIYLNSPGNDLTIKDRHFILNTHKNQISLNLPINLFLRSLAHDVGKYAVGIILSGTGSDGTLGIRAIKEEGGMIIAQDDRTAKFDGMPRSSISTGLVDFILPPAEMGSELLRYSKHPYMKERSLVNEFEADQQKSGTFSQVLRLLKAYCGVDFSLYKENTIIRRLERRISVNRLTTLEEYFLLLKDSDKEKGTLYRELLIGVTNFFRDTEAFKTIMKEVIPNFDYTKKSIRIWCAACSTGEEAYSIAMMVRDYIEKNGIDCEVKIFATDIERESLEFAGKGVYSESVVSDIDPEYLEKYFTIKDRMYQIKDTIRNMVVFACHNILKDPPFSKLDLLVCRNLFIYLRPEMQQRLLSIFYYSLSPKGFLFMGSSESIGEMSEAYAVVDNKWKIYKCKENYQRLHTSQHVYMMNDRMHDDERLGLSSLAPSKLRVEKIVEAAAAKALSPSVLIDEEGVMIHVLNDMGEFLSIRPGRFSNSIFSNITGDLSLFVSSMLRRLKDKQDGVITEQISGLEKFPMQRISITGYTIEYQDCYYYLFSFQREDIKDIVQKEYHIDPKDMVSKRIAELEKELQIGKENLQATIEELETSNEELQSSNEELIASNEELQSTNEELQSVNEELYTVNSEYQYKIEELTHMTEDLDNLLINAEIGALYLDCNLCIRKITPMMSRITNIVQSDIGRPIYHITLMDFYPDFVDDVKEVLDKLQMIEKEINGSDGTSWLARIRPYRTKSYAVEGVILTLVEITNYKQVEKDLDAITIRYDQQETRMNNRQSVLNLMFDQIFGLKFFVDEKGMVLYRNQKAAAFFANLHVNTSLPTIFIQDFEKIKRDPQIIQKQHFLMIDNELQKWDTLIIIEPSFDSTNEFCGALFNIDLLNNENDNEK